MEIHKSKKKQISIKIDQWSHKVSFSPSNRNTPRCDKLVLGGWILTVHILDPTSNGGFGVHVINQGWWGRGWLWLFSHFLQLVLLCQNGCVSFTSTTIWAQSHYSHRNWKFSLNPRDRVATGPWYPSIVLCHQKIYISNKLKLKKELTHQEKFTKFDNFVVFFNVN